MRTSPAIEQIPGPLGNKDFLLNGGSGAHLWMVTGCRPSRVMEAGAHNPRKTGVGAHNPRITHRRQ